MGILYEYASFRGRDELPLGRPRKNVATICLSLPESQVDSIRLLAALLQTTNSAVVSAWIEPHTATVARLSQILNVEGAEAMAAIIAKLRAEVMEEVTADSS